MVVGRTIVGDGMSQSPRPSGLSGVLQWFAADGEVARCCVVALPRSLAPVIRHKPMMSPQWLVPLM